MIQGISTGIGYGFNAYDAVSRARSGRAEMGVRAAAIPVAQPERPVQPVEPAKPVMSAPLDKAAMLQRHESDPVAMAVRGRIQYDEPADAPAANGDVAIDEAQSAAEVMAESECQTCSERTYQDGSNDPGVSFKTAAHIDPDTAASVVRGHEQEHVVRNRAEAEREDREVVSQSVTLHTDICPECGRVYVSGGTTRTVTRADQGAALADELKGPSSAAAAGDEDAA